MISKLPSFSETEAPIFESEGAITSASNIRPDEVILRLFESRAIITMFFTDGTFIDLPLHEGNQSHKATLIIPEKIYKEAEKNEEIANLLSGLFENQRNMEVKIIEKEGMIILQPVGKKNLFQITFVR